ncbi:hypothetical protein Tco_0614963, partial [Tanacetum coccineum]
MAISVISVSSYLSEESVRTSAGRVILFDTIPTTIPDTTPTSDPSEDPSPDRLTLLPATSPFLSSTDDSLDSDTLDTPPSPTHGTPFTEITLSTQSLPTTSKALHCRVMILVPGQPIPYGRPYRYHPNGPLHMLTARNRVGPLPTYRLDVTHSIDYSSSDLFTSDDSSETSSNFSSDDLSDSLSVLSIPLSYAVITEIQSHSSSAGPSRKRSRSPTTFVLIYSPIPGALSPARADLLPTLKRIRSSVSVTDLEDCSDESSELYVPRETSLRDEVVVKGSDEPYLEPDIDPEIQAEIDEYITYADDIRAEGIYARVVVKTVAHEEVETSTRGPVELKVDRVMRPALSDDIPKPAQEKGAIEGTYETLGDLVQRFHDHTLEIPVHRVQVIESIQKDQRHMILATGQQSTVMSERISDLERDNTRLRGTLHVASQRVTRPQRRKTMPNTRSGATMTRESVNELIACRVAKTLEACDAARNLEPLVEGRGEQEDKNGDDYAGRNGGLN